MRKAVAACLALGIIIIFGCGGGGSAVPTATLVGRVLQVTTGGVPSPQASVQVGLASVLTDVGDGSFSLVVPVGTTSVTVDTRSASGLWTFTIPSATGTIDVGDLWVGPDRVNIEGFVKRSTDGAAIAGAIVSFGGRKATTGANGRFSLVEVAYSNANQTAFWGIVGSASKTGYFRNDFSASPNVANAGVVTVSDILLTPSDDDIPPPPPYNIWGRVNPSIDATGTVVTLLEATTPIQVASVGAGGAYYFWVQPGTYSVKAEKGARTVTASVTLPNANQLVRKDVTLP